MSLNTSLGIKQDRGEIFLIHYKNGDQPAIAVTNEKQAYWLAEVLDGLVTHVPLFSSCRTALKDSNIAYEAERIASERCSNIPKHATARRDQVSDTGS